MTKDAKVYIPNNTFKSPVKETASAKGNYVNVTNAKGKNAKTLKISGNVSGSKKTIGYIDNGNVVEFDYMVKVHGITFQNTIVGENTNKSGYQNNNLMIIE